MNCPYCLHKGTQVYNSRPTKKLNQTWRRRRCQECKREFTTFEQINLSSVLKIKRNGKSSPYRNEKLLLSLQKACDHRSDQEIAAAYLLQIIEQILIAKSVEKRQTIEPMEIIDTVQGVLKRFDKVAWIKYRSYRKD